MKTVERNVVRLAVVQHLRATYGIKTKNWNKCKTSNKLTGSSVKVFGVALESLPHCHVLDYGDIACFLVDACTCLMSHLDTEGLFRKSGSIVRVKALRAKLDQAEECLATALPLDIAGLLKQFFRELPEPVLPTDLQNAFLKAQELLTVEEKTSATLLLSCVLPHENLNTLRYFFSFLKRVSKRCTVNKMDSSNLSVIFAPNLLHCGDGTEKMNASTEKRLKLQAAVVQCLIDNAEDLGVVPEFLIAKVPAMLGCEAGLFSPSDAVEEGHTPSGTKKSRRSLGDMVNGALNKLKSNRTPSHTPQFDATVLSAGTPVVITPKRKLPMESGQSYGFSNKKRRSIKKNLGLELFPSSFFGGGSTPGSVHSASGTLDSSHSALSSVGRSSQLSASSARRKSKRLIRRNINRVESGKAGCFSPRVTKKEATRKSLRLRFSLGKMNRDCNVVSHSLPVPKGSEVIGWRLATQESVTSFHFTKDTAFSPSVLRNSPSTGSKYISKSEDNLLTPCGAKEPGTSWSRESPHGTQQYTGNTFSDTPMSACLKTTYRSEPTIIISKPPASGNIPKNLCCATSAESLTSSESFSEECSQTGPTLLRIRALDEPGSLSSDKDLREKMEESTEDIPVSSELTVLSENSPAPSGDLKKDSALQVTQSLVVDHNVTFGQFEIAPLSPLHIDSALFETEATEHSSVLGNKTHESSLNAEHERSCFIADSSTDSASCSQLINALDIQSPAAFRLNSSITVQSTPFAARERTRKLSPSKPEDFKKQLLVETSPEPSSQHGREPATMQESQQLVCTTDAAELRRIRVADHIRRFNMLTLNSPQTKMVRSPLKFHRTPVRQSVRRINSLLGQRKETRSGWCAASRGTSAMKALSLESGLFTGAHQESQPTEVPGQTPDEGVSLKPKPPPIKSATCSTIRHCALGDLTNTMTPKAKGDNLSTKSAPSEVPKSVLLHAAERNMSHYRGSPKNPLTQGRLLSATKPLDL